MGARQHPDTAKALKRIAAGMKVGDAAKVFGIHRDTLYKALRKLKRVRELPTKEWVDTLP